MDSSSSPNDYTEYDYEDQLIALIGEEDTIVGFLLAGVGHRNKRNQLNYVVLDNDASEELIMSHIENFITREEIAMILITYETAIKVRPFLLEYKSFLPVILEIPSKYHHYNPDEDEIMSKLASKYGDDERRGSV